jgi:hypothetical protein
MNIAPVSTLLRTLWHHGDGWLAAGDKTSKKGRSTGCPETTMVAESDGFPNPPAVQ